MELNMNDILLFKTDIRTEGDKQLIAKVMQEYKIANWTVDQDDIDCVLRIVSSQLKLHDVIDLVVHNGYQCEELT
ncbi:hypothetical protein DBR43_18000 [Pedobacter sp. KBW06]|uniref:hypothetical protein n=1 Tax=Pedobacter sp. KBW06 TaxID=2153359 RepID=UPI000F594374|nr:hypothetical protein [Pedobacter sp. KBW06]RQO69938.1 hypothetical protein DBR43_18000 [Pedobacter sp. KBW06]